jgi:uncharacterized membrane protein YbhN (UPF0104 family)
LKKLFNNILKFSLSLGLGFFLVWIAARNLTPDDIAKMKDAFARTNYWWLGLSLIVGFISNFLRALRWRLLLQPLGHNPSIANTAYAVNIMYFGNLAFPRLGEISRCALLSRYENIPLDKTIGTMITERLVDVISLLLVGVYLFFSQYDVLAGYFETTFFNKQNAGNTAWIKWVILGTGAVFALAGWLLLKHFKHNPFVQKIWERVEGLLEGVKSILQLKNPGLFIFYSVAIWLSYSLLGYVCFFSLSETAGLSFNVAIAQTFFGGFAYIATQGGIGAYPLVVQAVLTLYGVEGAIGYAFGWIEWVLQTLLVIVTGLGSLVLIATMNKISESSSLESDQGQTK